MRFPFSNFVSSSNKEGKPKYDAGVTGLALLAFLGAGHTSRIGKYKADYPGDALRKVLASNALHYEDWENKIHKTRPLLCDEDAPIAEFRAWASQFYPDR